MQTGRRGGDFRTPIRPLVDMAAKDVEAHIDLDPDPEPVNTSAVSSLAKTENDVRPASVVLGDAEPGSAMRITHGQDGSLHIHGASLGGAPSETSLSGTGENTISGPAGVSGGLASVILSPTSINGVMSIKVSFPAVHGESQISSGPGGASRVMGHAAGARPIFSVPNTGGAPANPSVELSGQRSAQAVRASPSPVSAHLGSQFSLMPKQSRPNLSSPLPSDVRRGGTRDGNGTPSPHGAPDFVSPLRALQRPDTLPKPMLLTMDELASPQPVVVKQVKKTKTAPSLSSKVSSFTSKCGVESSSRSRSGGAAVATPAKSLAHRIGSGASPGSDRPPVSLSPTSVEHLDKSLVSPRMTLRYSRAATPEMRSDGKTSVFASERNGASEDNIEDTVIMSRVLSDSSFHRSNSSTDSGMDFSFARSTTTTPTRISRRAATAASVFSTRSPGSRPLSPERTVSPYLAHTGRSVSSAVAQSVSVGTSASASASAAASDRESPSPFTRDALVESPVSVASFHSPNPARGVSPFAPRSPSRIPGFDPLSSESDGGSSGASEPELSPAAEDEDRVRARGRSRRMSHHITSSSGLERERERIEREPLSVAESSRSSLEESSQSSRFRQPRIDRYRLNRSISRDRDGAAPSENHFNDSSYSALNTSGVSSIYSHASSAAGNDGIHRPVDETDEAPAPKDTATAGDVYVLPRGKAPVAAVVRVSAPVTSSLSTVTRATVLAGAAPHLTSHHYRVPVSEASTTTLTSHVPHSMTPDATDPVARRSRSEVDELPSRYRLLLRSPPTDVSSGPATLTSHLKHVVDVDDQQPAPRSVPHPVVLPESQAESFQTAYLSSPSLGLPPRNMVLPDVEIDVLTKAAMHGRGKPISGVRRRLLALAINAFVNVSYLGDKAKESLFLQGVDTLPASTSHATFTYTAEHVAAFVNKFQTVRPAFTSIEAEFLLSNLRTSIGQDERMSNASLLARTISPRGHVSDFDLRRALAPIASGDAVSGPRLWSSRLLGAQRGITPSGSIHAHAVNTFLTPVRVSEARVLQTPTSPAVGAVWYEAYDQNQWDGDYLDEERVVSPAKSSPRSVVPHLVSASSTTCARLAFDESSTFARKHGSGGSGVFSRRNRSRFPSGPPSSSSQAVYSGFADRRPTPRTVQSMEEAVIRPGVHVCYHGREPELYSGKAVYLAENTYHSIHQTGLLLPLDSPASAIQETRERLLVRTLLDLYVCFRVRKHIQDSWRATWPGTLLSAFQLLLSSVAKTPNPSAMTNAQAARTARCASGQRSKGRTVRRVPRPHLDSWKLRGRHASESSSSESDSSLTDGSDDLRDARASKESDSVSTSFVGGGAPYGFVVQRASDLHASAGPTTSERIAIADVCEFVSRQLSPHSSASSSMDETVSTKSSLFSQRPKLSRREEFLNTSMDKRGFDCSSESEEESDYGVSDDDDERSEIDSDSSLGHTNGGSFSESEPNACRNQSPKAIASIDLEHWRPLLFEDTALSFNDGQSRQSTRRPLPHFLYYSQFVRWFG